jgi:hypothetical protein
VKIKLLIKATAKKIPDTTFTLVVVLGSSKLAPIEIINVTERKTKLQNNLKNLQCFTHN